MVVETLFRRARFRVTRNSAVARPRQTDLFAAYGDQNFVIEAKAMRRRAGTPEVDAIRARLDRTTPGTVGVLICLSGFAEEAVGQVLGRRSQPILLLDEAGLKELLSRPAALYQQLQAKLRLLVEEGRTRLPTGSARTPRRVPVEELDTLPKSGVTYVARDKARSPWIACGGGFDPLVFAQELPDIDWVPAADSRGVSLDIPLRARDEGEILEALIALSRLGWVTEHARWSIKQAQLNWNGAGAREFASALSGWSGRYRGLRGLHHTETAIYFDVCEGGFYTLEFQLAAKAPRFVWQANLSLHLTGIPLSDEPIQHVQTSIGELEPSYFRTLSGRSVVSVRSHGERIRLEPRYLVVSSGPSFGSPELQEEWVKGIVAANPFFGPDGRGVVGAAPDAWPETTRDSELLVCSLGSHHMLGDRPRSYYLRGWESTWTADAQVSRIVAEW